MIYFTDTSAKLNLVRKQQIDSKDWSNISVEEGKDRFYQELEYWNHQKSGLTQEREQRSP